MEDKFNKYLPQRMKQLLKKSTTAAVSILIGLLGIGLIIGACAFNKVHVESAYETYEPTVSHEEVQEEVADKEKKKPVVMSDKNIVVFGVDKEESRTDTILVVHFDSKNSEVCVVSIPRDTKVYWSDEQIEKAEEIGCPYQYYGKITDMSSLGGIENLRYFTIRSIEELMDIKVDNYVVINTQIIREIVDKLGGIEFDVPREMKYTDNWQGLHIDLQPGLQLLNGEQAEGLLRWRHNDNYTEQYALGDLGRIETQQAFIKVFMDKVLNDLSVSKILSIVSSIYSNVRTDIGFTQIMTYLGYMDYISEDSINLMTLPGESIEEDLWYYVTDEEEIRAFVEENFYGLGEVSELDEVADQAEVYDEE